MKESDREKQTAQIKGKITYTINDVDTMAMPMIVVGSQSVCSEIIGILLDISFSGNTSGIGIRSVMCPHVGSTSRRGKIGDEQVDGS